MKQKAIVMATTFTMLMAMGITGVGSESLHQHPAYRYREAMQIEQIQQTALQDTQQLLLPAPPQKRI